MPELISDLGVIRSQKEIEEIEFEVPEQTTSRNKHSQLRKELRLVLKQDLKGKPWEAALDSGYEELKSFVKAYNSFWSKAPGRPPIKILAGVFGISEPTVQKLRRDLELPLLNSPDHPKIREIKKRIKRLYLTKEYGTEMIGKILKCSAQTVQNYLHDMKITMKPQHITNCKYFRTKSKFSPTRLLKEIKDRYEKGMKLKKIAEEVGVWEGTVSSKLIAMGLDPPRTGRREVNCTYGTCVWCGAKFRRYISNGPKKQIFCSRSHKNKAKDLRRSLTPRKIKSKIRPNYENHFRNLSLEFKGRISRLNLPIDVEEKVREYRGAPMIRISPKVRKSFEEKHREEANILKRREYGKKYYENKKSDTPKKRKSFNRVISPRKIEELEARKLTILSNLKRTISSGSLYDKVKHQYNNYRNFQRDIKRLSKEGVIKTRLLKKKTGGFVTLISRGKHNGGFQSSR